MDPTSPYRSWYYVDSWKWVMPTWGGSTAGGQWAQAGSKGPFYGNAWNADFETQWMADNMKLQGIDKPLVRRFRYTGSSWVREV